MPRTTLGSSHSFMRPSHSVVAGDRARRRTSMARRGDLVARGLDRPGAHPTPYQHDVSVRSVVEAVPAAARRIDDVALDRRLLAEVAVDVAAALDHDEELVAVAMQVPFMAGAGLEPGPAHHVIGAGGFFIDQELNLHVHPAVLARQALDLRHVTDVGAVHRRTGALRRPWLVLLAPGGGGGLHGFGERSADLFC